MSMDMKVIYKPESSLLLLAIDTMLIIKSLAEITSPQAFGAKSNDGAFVLCSLGRKA